MEEQNILLNPKTAELIVAVEAVKEPYGQKISKKTDTTYSHTCKTMNKLEEKDIVTKEKKGRKQVYQLTETGKQLAELYRELLSQAGMEIPRRPLMA